jgi:hypothetical protein
VKRFIARSRCRVAELASRAGLSWENVLDYDAFTNAVRTELMSRVIDLENAELWGGDPTAGRLNSLTKTAGDSHEAGWCPDDTAEQLR